MTELTTRGKKALKVLAAGGEFAKRLEHDPYLRRGIWRYRLRDENGHRVRGVGTAVFYELLDKGLIRIVNETSVSTYYRLAPEFSSATLVS